MVAGAGAGADADSGAGPRHRQRTLICSGICPSPSAVPGPDIYSSVRVVVVFCFCFSFRVFFFFRFFAFDLFWFSFFSLVSSSKEALSEPVFSLPCSPHARSFLFLLRSFDSYSPPRPVLVAAHCPITRRSNKDVTQITNKRLPNYIYYIQINDRLTRKPIKK